MDQVHSLINRLTRQVAANVHSAELLSTIEMLRQEIMKAGAPVVKQGQSVYVWMPSALSQSKTNGQIQGHSVTTSTDGYQNGPAEVVETPKEPVTDILVKAEPPIPERTEEPVATPTVPRQVYAAPIPPVIAKIPDTPAPEPEPEPVAVIKPAVIEPTPAPVQVINTPEPAPVAAKEAPVPSRKIETPATQEDDEEFVLDSEPTDEELANQPYMPKVARQSVLPLNDFPAPEVNHAFMKVQELAAAKHAQMASTVTTVEAPAARSEAAFSKFHGLESRVKNTFPVAPPPAPKKEINELVVDEGQALNQKLKAGHIELGEVLASGPRIADLRKAFGINERYQFINGLFRGDADMFDRSLRTLNNFGNHQEASFWMQRELVIKMGWNEDDDLVQQFYKILARRF